MRTTPREEQAIQLVSERLHQRFPAVPMAKVEDTVQRNYHQFDGSRIRDYVPIFVERRAREELTKVS